MTIYVPTSPTNDRHRHRTPSSKTVTSCIVEDLGLSNMAEPNTGIRTLEQWDLGFGATIEVILRAIYSHNIHIIQPLLGGGRTQCRTMKNQMDEIIDNEMEI